jgi:DNA-binding HxlR family transcriptional regulator
MLQRDYRTQTCSIARSLEIVGERWTLLILRNVFLGWRRFDEQQRQLGIARNVLASRLQRLVDEQILELRPYGERPVRHEYHLTEKGRALWPVLAELLQWGDRYAPEPAGPPRIFRHKECGGLMGAHLICERCGQWLDSEDVISELGPGAGAGARRLQKARRASASAAPASA